MYPSIFTDELKMDFAKALPIIKSWGLEAVDLRGLIFGRAFEDLSAEQLAEVKRLLDAHGLRVGCLQSSLAKVHLPGAERQRAEERKLEGVIRAADALGCRLVRAFHYWQPTGGEVGQLAVRPDLLQQVLTMFAPLAERAHQAGLLLAFENCGVSTAEVKAVVEALGVHEWGLAWDVSNEWMSPLRQANETDYIVDCARHARCVHVKAVRAVAGLGEETIPYDRVLATCAAAGMDGPVSAETHNPDPTVPDEVMSRRVVEVIQRAWPTAAPASLYEAAKPKPRAAARPWQDQPVGFAVVGLGMGHNRARQITETPGARLVGVCDLLEERARRSAQEFGVPYTLDARRWLDNKEVEVVYVMTPTGRHAEIAKMALEAGKHVITTKPMEASLAACDEMIRLAEKKDLLLAVDFGRRFEEDLHTLRNAVRKGLLGRLLGGDVSVKILRPMSYFQGIGSWHGTKRWDGGGVLSNQSIHHIDEVAFTVGIPSKVRANVWTQTHDIEAEDLGVAAWLYDNGLVLTFMGTTSYPQPTWYYRFELHGSEGAFSSTYGGMNDKPATWWYTDKEWTHQAPERVEPDWLNAADNMAAAIRTGAALTCDGRDGRRSQAILDGMYRSAYSGGGWVDVTPELT
jgi:UDP-N-acetyl-2-amino-2-deoxyglucuronate dehydrogenase